MGAKSSKKRAAHRTLTESDLEDDYFVNYPIEIVAHILSFLPPKDLQTCTRVCHLLRELATSNSLWRVKSIRDGRFVEANMAPFYPTDWREFYLKQPFTRNLIKNCSGQDKFEHWEILANGGDGWLVENGAGSDAKPQELLASVGGEQLNFATSYGWCKKRQIIDLVACGIDEKMLDELQPPLRVGEWNAARFDCGNVYELEVALLRGKEATDETALLRGKEATDETIIDTFKVEVETPQWADKNWKEVSHVFKEYGPGLRFVQFMHQSKDRQFWAGHYGAKMAGSYVRVSFESAT